MVIESTAAVADHYQVGDLLGRGGAGDVHRATDVLLGRTVALKMLRAPADRRQRARLATEARALASLDHPALVTLWDAALEDTRRIWRWSTSTDRRWRPAWTAPRCRGIDGDADRSPGGRGARPRAPGRGGAPRREAGQHPARPRGTGEAGRPRERLAGRRLSAPATDPDGRTYGTAVYVAPELVTEDAARRISGAADVYSLGLVLLEMLTGRRAFVGPCAEIVRAHVWSRPDIPAELGSGWVSLLTRMTARDPAARPPAVEVTEMLVGLP